MVLSWGQPEEEGLVWWLEIEKITSWVNSSEMAQVNVRELRKQKQQKKGNTFIFLIQLQLWKAGEFKPKKGLQKPNQTFSGL